jgi:hypothetical protein
MDNDKDRGSITITVRDGGLGINVDGIVTEADLAIAVFHLTRIANGILEARHAAPEPSGIAIARGIPADIQPVS